jgi:hypothetical protein
MRILNIINSKEKNISILFEPEENKSILSMKNLDIQNEKVEEIIPLTDKSDSINDVSYNFDHIFKILSKIEYPENKIREIKKDTITQKDIENIWLFKVKSIKIKDRNKHKNKNKTQKTIEKKEIKEKKEVKRGRKSKKNCEDIPGSHNKDCPDNIIRKIKAFFFSSVIEYIQTFINRYKQNLKNDIKLLTLDYKNVNRLEKKFNIKLLEATLQDLISLDISSKYKNHDNNKDWNKKIIKKVLEQEKNNAIIISLLKMSFDKWIDIFTYKKHWIYNIEIKGIKSFLEKIQSETDSQYFSKVIFYLFNFQKWFLHKSGRQPKKNKNDNKK